MQFKVPRKGTETYNNVYSGRDADPDHDVTKSNPATRFLRNEYWQKQDM